MRGMLHALTGRFAGAITFRPQTRVVRAPASFPEPALRLLLDALGTMGHAIRLNAARGALLVSGDAVETLARGLRDALERRPDTVKTLKELERRPEGTAPSSPWAVADALGGGRDGDAAPVPPAVAAAGVVGPLLRSAEQAARSGASLLLLRR